MSEAAVPRRNRLILAQWAELLEDDAFRRFWIMRLASQAASSGLTYALMVFTVRHSSNAVATGLLLLTFVVPSAFLGAFAGVVVDWLPRGLILFVSNALRVFLTFLLIGGMDSLISIYAISTGFTVVNQFTVPAEAAVLPHVIRPERMTAANSVVNLGTLVAQVMGMLGLAPALLKATDGTPLLFVIMGLFATAGIVVTIIPQFKFIPEREKARVSIGAARREFAEAWMALLRDPVAFFSLVLLVSTATSILVVGTLVPKFATHVLHVSAENIVFVLAPAAVGIFLGLRLVEWIAGRLNKLVTISAAYLLMAAALVALGLVSETGRLIQFDPLNEQASRILATIIYSNAYGFAFTVVMTMGRVLLYERVPVERQGRVFAAQSVLANLAAILPVLLAGIMADTIGVEPVFIAGGIVAVLAAVWSRAQSSRAVPARENPATG